MAVGGERLSDTLRLGSEELQTIPCSLCIRDGNHVAAVKYCRECGENYCSKCLTTHDRFTGMRVHQITDTLSSQTGQRLDLPIQRCERHGGKLVDEYCPCHDAVGCVTCISVEHSSCKDIKYIPEMIQGLQMIQEVSNLESKLELHLRRLYQMKQDKKDNKKRLRHEKKKLLRDVGVLRKKINDQLDKMESMLINEIDSKSGTIERAVSNDIDIIVNQITLLERRQRGILNTKEVSNAELFVQLKMGNVELTENDIKLKPVTAESEAFKMKLIPSEHIQKLLENNSTALGHISEILVAKSVTPDRDVNVHLQSDGYTCEITDICLLTDGNIIIADYKNKRIEKLDNSYSVTEHLDIYYHPSRLCELDNSRIAVTLITQKKVHIVSRNPLSLGKSFPVGDRCRGIDCRSGQLYVFCGGCINDGEGPGHIEVYSITGHLLRCYYQGTVWPLCIKISDRGDLLVSN